MGMYPEGQLGKPNRFEKVCLWLIAGLIIIIGVRDGVNITIVTIGVLVSLYFALR